MWKRIAVLLSVFLFLAALCGCSSDSGGSKVLRYDIPAEIKNLDPQFATDSAARMIISNIYEGLLVREADGTLVPGAARLYTLSPDERTYTFHLREDAFWAGKEPVPVTAHDFVFAFRRLFSGGGASPYTADYLLIENAGDVLSGSRPLTDLGVRASDDYTLTITLEHPSSLFLELLSSTAAMPCNEALFTEARGRYGLERQFAGANGPFYVDSWSSSQINLRPNGGYASSEVLAGGVNLYIGKENPSSRLLNGSTDITQISYSELEEAETAELTIFSSEKTTWCIIFNQSHSIWGNALIRQGLAHAVDYSYIAEYLEENLRPASVLIPPDMLLLDKPYRDYAGDSPLAADFHTARRLFKLGLEALDMDTLPAATLYVPDTGGHALNMEMVGQGWQKELSAYINIRQAPVADIERRLAERNYEIMLVPFSPAGNRVESLLSAFASDSSQNRFGYYNPSYDKRLAQALDQISLEQAAFLFSQAEKTLLSDAVIIPVYTETSYYAMGKGVEGIQVSPFGSILSFKRGTRP